MPKILLIVEPHQIVNIEKEVKEIEKNRHCSANVNKIRIIGDTCKNSRFDKLLCQTDEKIAELQ